MNDIEFEIEESVSTKIDVGQVVTTPVRFKKTVEFSKDDTRELHRTFEEFFYPRLLDDEGNKLTKENFYEYMETLYEEINVKWEDLEDTFMLENLGCAQD